MTMLIPLQDVVEELQLEDDFMADITCEYPPEKHADGFPCTVQVVARITYQCAHPTRLVCANCASVMVKIIQATSMGWKHPYLCPCGRQPFECWKVIPV